MNNFNSVIAIISKEIKTEFRTKYSSSALLLFILTSLSIIMFSLNGVELSDELSSGLYWILIFFGSMTGLSKSFVIEEEKSTSMLLKMHSSSISIYLGKLLFNLLNSIIINYFTAILLLMFISKSGAKSPLILFSLIFVFSLVISSATTIISAMISKANARGAIFSVLSFPILLPVIISGIDITTASIAGTTIEAVANEIIFLLAYSGVLISVSIILFEIVWRD
jgi:heme exporter protein B